MPKLYEYLGLIILFYSNEHEPIHVHGRYQGTESKAELVFEDGKLVRVNILPVLGKKPLDSRNEKKLRKVIEVMHSQIVEKWMDFFIYNKPVKAEIITRKLI